MADEKTLPDNCTQSEAASIINSEYIKATSDWGFKYLFGNPGTKKALLLFLNIIFKGEIQVEDVEFRDKEQLPFTADGKTIIYDIYCIQKGERRHFIIEMQKRVGATFSNRALLYSVLPLLRQISRGGKYELDSVIGIYVLGENLRDMPQSPEHDIRLWDVATGTEFSDRLRLVFLNLPQAPDNWNECNTELLQLIYIIKNMEKLTKDSAPCRDIRFRDLFEAARTNELKEGEYIAYSQSIFKEMEDREAIEEEIDDRVRERIEKEAAALRNEGRMEGEKKGRMEGEKKGRFEAIREVARTLKQLGNDLVQIQKATGLEMSVIEAL